MVNIFPTPLVPTVHVRSIFQHVLCRRKRSHEIPTPVTALDQRPQFSNTSCGPSQDKNIPTPAVPGGYTILFSNTSTAGGKKRAVSQHQLWPFFLYYLFYANTRCAHSGPHNTILGIFIGDRRSLSSVSFHPQLLAFGTWPWTWPESHSVLQTIKISVALWSP